MLLCWRECNAPSFPPVFNEHLSNAHHVNKSLYKKKKSVTHQLQSLIILTKYTAKKIESIANGSRINQR